MSADYRIESSQPLSSRFLPAGASEQYLVKDRALAVALAAKSFSHVNGARRPSCGPTPAATNPEARAPFSASKRATCD
jgi:hypothetical protein